MSQALAGKGMWIWQLAQCENGDPARILARAVQAGLTHVLVKVADGPNAWHGNVQALVSMLRQGGLAVWGWQYTYGNEPAKEADVAGDRIKSLGLDGFVIDAESEYEGRKSAAKSYVAALRGQVESDFPLALSTFYLPDLHASFPYDAFLEQCDWAMPQIYWYQRDPVQALERSLQQHARFGKPVFPTGAAYEQAATADGIRRFLQAVQESHRAGVNFWSWQHARLDMWQVIQNATWKTPRLIAARLVQDNWDYHQVLSTFVDNQFRVRSRDLASALGQPGGTDVSQPVRSAVEELKWTAEFATQHLQDPEDPRVYLFVHSTDTG